MPEGPEAFYLANFLKSKILNKNFTKIISNTKTIRNIPSKSKVIDVLSKGKKIWIETTKYYVHLHMGISGWLVEEKPKIYKYVLEFGKFKLWLKDRRRFSKIDIFKKNKDGISSEHEKELNSIGINVLSKDFTLQKFTENLEKSNRNISALLMDQTVFCGIGNYIRNDALYLAKIHPERKVFSLTQKEIKKLYEKIKFVTFSNAIEWLKIDNLPIPKYILEICPKKLSVPYKFRIYEKETVGKFKVQFKIVAGRKTYFIESQK